MGALIASISCAQVTRGGGPQDVASDGKEINNLLRDPLIERIGRDRFDLWFDGHTSFSLRGKRLTARIGSAFYRDWIRTHFRGDLEAVAQIVFGHEIELSFQIGAIAKSDRNSPAANKSGSAKKKSAKDSQAEDSKQQVLFDVSEYQAETPDGTIASGLSVINEPKGDTPTAGKAQGAQRAARTRQAARSNKPSKPNHTSRRQMTLDSFVVGASNRLAHTSAQIAIERPGQVSPLVFHGETGVGKTHLLEAIRNEALRGNRRCHAVYMTAEQFTSQFLEALNGNGSPNFRSKVRNVELLLIDDVQFFAGKKATQDELLYTIDTLIQNGQQLVFTADRPPAQLDRLSRELVGRLSGGLVCPIESADFSTRLGIVEKLAQRLEVELSEEVRSLVAASITGSARRLAGAINRLQAVSLAQQEPITRSLAESALGELTRQHGRRVQLPEIEKAVCELFGVSSKNLKSSQRAKAVSHPRMLAMWLARKHTRSGLSEIGHFFGHRSHSTVISASKQVERWMNKSAAVDVVDRTCDIEEAIRKVEQSLRIA